MLQIRDPVPSIFQPVAIQEVISHHILHTMQGETVLPFGEIKGRYVYCLPPGRYVDEMGGIMAVFADGSLFLENEEEPIDGPIFRL